MTKHEKELVRNLIKSIEMNTTDLWVDSLEYTVEAIVYQDIDTVNDCEEEVTEDNFDIDCDGHVLCPSKMNQDNKFTGSDISKIISQLKTIIK